MIFYHRTTAENARSILAHGFKDATDRYLTSNEYTGVWLSIIPADINEGAKGDTLLKVVLDASDEELAYWEWVEEGKGFREWLIPAVVINSRGRVALSGELE